MGQEITGPADTHRYEQVIIQPVHFCEFKFLSIVVAVFHPVHYHGIESETIFHIYTPGIYADGYIVFAFPFVRSYVR